MTAPARKPRPRRIAADEAHSWARNLRLGNSLAKLVLSMCTIYVDGEGRCFPGIESLAEDTELSVDTVRKRLAWLEQVGAVARFPQWIDDAGRRNGDGRGKRTSDEIRLLMDADPDEIERRARGEQDDAGSGDVHDFSPSHQQGLNPADGSFSPRLAHDQPSDSGKGSYDSDSSNQEPESPPNPPSGGCTTADVEVEGWQEFKTSFEADGDPIVRVSLAMQLYGALSAGDERSRCTKAAKGLIAWRLKQKKPPSKPSAQTFIREIGAWPTWAEHAPPDPVPIEPPTFIAEGSEDWKALCVIARIRGETDPQPRRYPDHEAAGLMIRKPLTPAKRALSQFYDSDPATWNVVEHGSQQCGAWVGLTGAEPHSVDTGETKRMQIGSKIIEHWPVKLTGLRIPWPWPPRKDGSLCDTAA